MSRTARPGCSAGQSSSWARRSGLALTRIQSSPPSLTAREDCVLRRARIVPFRTPRQLGQLQFHWGKPPPAPEPSTKIFMAMGLPQKGLTTTPITMPIISSVGTSFMMR